MLGIDGRELRFTVLISTVHLFEHFLMRLVPPLIPVLAVALEYPLWQLGLLVSVFYFASGLSQAPLGILSDRYDRRFILPTGLGLAGSSYLLFALAPQFGTIIPSASLQGYAFEGGFLVMSVSMLGVGIGTSVVHPTAYPLITANVSETNKGKILGAFGSSSKVGDAAAPAIIAVLILILVWDRILLLLGVITVLWSVLLYAILARQTIETVPVDHGSSSAAAENSQQGALDRREYAYPMAVIYVFFVTKMFAGAGLNTFLPVFLVSVYALSIEFGSVAMGPESVANLYFAALLVSAAVSQLAIGALTDRYDARAVILWSLVIATISLVGLALLDLSPFPLLLVMVILGAGLWGMNPARDALISEITPPEREGRTFGYIWTAVRLAGTAIPVLVGYLLEAVGMREGLVVLAIGTVLAAAAIGLLYSERIYQPRPHPQVQPSISD